MNTLVAQQTLPTAVLHVEMQHLIDDLQFLIGRPEECTFLLDQFRRIHDRRTCVEDREQFERPL
jgi:hypothetical protein